MQRDTVCLVLCTYAWHINQTYTAASTPSVKDAAFMQRFKIFWESISCRPFEMWLLTAVPAGLNSALGDNRAESQWNTVKFLILFNTILD